MSVADRDARLQASVYRTFGEPARWISRLGGAPVEATVIPATAEEIARFGDSQAIIGTALFRVRPIEVPLPEEGDSVVTGTLVDQVFVPGPIYRVIAEPIRTRFGLDWMCQAEIA